MKKVLMQIIITFFLITLGFFVSAQDTSGLVTFESLNTIDETQARLEAAIEEAGLRVVLVLDHAANAANVELDLQPTRLVLFGNPNVGTPLMQSAQTIAIDLPQKMLIWEDEQGRVFVSYNDPMYLKTRHGIEGQDQRLDNISGALQKLAVAATEFTAFVEPIPPQ